MKSINLLASIAMFTVSLVTSAQEKENNLFNGIVTDMTGEPIRKVKVYLHSPSLYAMSDKRGHFGFSNITDDDTLHLVYKRKHYIIPVEGHKGLRIKLGDQLNALSEADEELAYIGYSFVKRRESTGASNGITHDELVRTGQTDLVAALRSKVPGISIGGGSFPGQKSKIKIRSVETVYGDATPLYLVDDMPVESLDGINVNVVEYVEVIKDANIYGARGANGVISVHTRKH